MKPTEVTVRGKCRDPDLVRAENAMRRAARNARERAAKAGGGIMVWKNEQVVEEYEENRGSEMSKMAVTSDDRHES